MKARAELNFAYFFARDQVAFHNRRLQTIEGFIGASIGLWDEFQHTLLTIL
jgi:hypothetical protein